MNPDAKQKARDFIIKTFREQGLHTWTQEFPSNNAQYPGINIIGQLSGRYSGSRDDKIVLIGAHYDSVVTSPGVGDNGSGMTALLQALKLHTSPDKLSCSRSHTLLFVAFDLEENQLSCGLANCSCQGISPCGSDYFVQNLTRYLSSTGVGFQGAFVLDTILNHNTTPNSQNFPSSLQLLFSSLYQKVSDNQFKGDFLATIGRTEDDIKLLNAVADAFQSDATFRSQAVEIPAPFVGRPSTWDPIYRAQMSDFFRSDHYPFWDADPSLPAVFLTDTAENRGFMEQCYHQSCDDFSHVTPDMITFLVKTTDSITKAVSRMTNETCKMKKTECGQAITANEGEITTPYYNKEYPNKLDCAWSISLDVERKDLKLKFTAFDLEESKNCTADYVEIRNGKNINAPLIAKYCGKTLPGTIEASTQSLYIVFHSDELAAFKGFKAQWSSTSKTQSSTPETKSSAKGYHQGMWLLICLLVVTSFTVVL